MSRLGVNHALRAVVLDEEAAQAYLNRRDTFLGGFDLTDEERTALRDLDYKTLYGMGSHPFLLNGFLGRVWPGDRRSFMAEFRQAIAPLGYPDHNV